MTIWHEGPMTAFDVESGGVDVETHRIVTITAASIGASNGKRPKVDVWSGLIAVDVDIDPAATEVHGITSEYAREHGKPAADVLDVAAGLLAVSLHRGIPVVGMNLAFDWTILDRECRRWGVPTVEGRLEGHPLAPVLDVLVLDKAMDRYRPGKRRLENLCEVYGVRHGGAHDATEDALAAARIAYVMGRRAHADFDTLCGLYAGRRYPDRIARGWMNLSKLTLPDLHLAQQRWYAEQSESLGMYWAGEAEKKRSVLSGPEATDEARAIAAQEIAELEAKVASLTTDWPIRPLVAEAVAA